MRIIPSWWLRLLFVTLWTKCVLTTFRDMTFEHLSKLSLNRFFPSLHGWNENPTSSGRGKEDSKRIFYSFNLHRSVNLYQVLKGKTWERWIHRHTAGNKVKGAKWSCVHMVHNHMVTQFTHVYHGLMLLSPKSVTNCTYKFHVSH